MRIITFTDSIEREGVFPFSVERVLAHIQVERFEFQLGHLAAGRERVGLEFGVDIQVVFGRGFGDQVDKL